MESFVSNYEAVLTDAIPTNCDQALDQVNKLVTKNNDLSTHTIDIADSSKETLIEFVCIEIGNYLYSKNQERVGSSLDCYDEAVCNNTSCPEYSRHLAVGCDMEKATYYVSPNSNTPATSNSSLETIVCGDLRSLNNVYDILHKCEIYESDSVERNLSETAENSGDLQYTIYCYNADVTGENEADGLRPHVLPVIKAVSCSALNCINTNEFYSHSTESLLNRHYANCNRNTIKSTQRNHIKITYNKFKQLCEKKNMSETKSKIKIKMAHSEPLNNSVETSNKDKSVDRTKKKSPHGYHGASKDTAKQWCIADYKYDLFYKPSINSFLAILTDAEENSIKIDRKASHKSIENNITRFSRNVNDRMGVSGKECKTFDKTASNKPKENYTTTLYPLVKDKQSDRDTKKESRRVGRKLSYNTRFSRALKYKQPNTKFEEESRKLDKRIAHKQIPNRSTRFSSVLKDKQRNITPEKECKKLDKRIDNKVKENNISKFTRLLRNTQPDTAKEKVKRTDYKANENNISKFSRLLRNIQPGTGGEKSKITDYKKKDTSKFSRKLKPDTDEEESKRADCKAKVNNTSKISKVLRNIQTDTDEEKGKTADFKSKGNNTSKFSRVLRNIQPDTDEEESKRADCKAKENNISKFYRKLKNLQPDTYEDKDKTADFKSKGNNTSKFSRVLRNIQPDTDEEKGKTADFKLKESNTSKFSKKLKNLQSDTDEEKNTSKFSRALRNIQPDTDEEKGKTADFKLKGNNTSKFSKKLKNLQSDTDEEKNTSKLSRMLKDIPHELRVLYDGKNVSESEESMLVNVPLDLAKCGVLNEGLPTSSQRNKIIKGIPVFPLFKDFRPFAQFKPSSTLKEEIYEGFTSPTSDKEIIKDNEISTRIQGRRRMNNMLENNKYQTLKDNMKSALRVKMKKELEDKLKKSIENRLNNMLENELNKAMEDNLSNALEDNIMHALEDSTEDDLRDSMEDVLGDCIEHELKNGVKKAMENRIKNVLENSMKKAMEDTIKKVLEDNVRNEVKHKIMNNLEDGVKKVMENRMKKAMEDSVASLMDVIEHVELEKSAGKIRTIRTRKYCRKYSTFNPNVTGKEIIFESLVDSESKDISRTVSEETPLDRLHKDLKSSTSDVEIIKEIDKGNENSRKNSLESSMKETMEDGVKNELEVSMKNELEVSMKNELEDRMKKTIETRAKKAMEEKVENALEERVKNALENSVNKAMVDSVSSLMDTVEHVELEKRPENISTIRKRKYCQKYSTYNSNLTGKEEIFESPVDPDDNKVPKIEPRKSNPERLHEELLNNIYRTVAIKVKKGKNKFETIQMKENCMPDKECKDITYEKMLSFAIENIEQEYFMKDNNMRKENQKESLITVEKGIGCIKTQVSDRKTEQIAAVESIYSEHGNQVTSSATFYKAQHIHKAVWSDKTNGFRIYAANNVINSEASKQKYKKLLFDNHQRREIIEAEKNIKELIKKEHSANTRRKLSHQTLAVSHSKCKTNPQIHDVNFKFHDGANVLCKPKEDNNNNKENSNNNADKNGSSAKKTSLWGLMLKQTAKFVPFFAFQTAKINIDVLKK
ncbi:hypothetical protein O3M35_006783 [Rhynocoris fuscipes]|uniref:Uncharacterized protein n=1 Tax=Rhynocoris fuscipes TaxID=488301 RepID=A0AAW1DEZ1_9HEMI